jgi:hypothetical protein
MWPESPATKACSNILTELQLIVTEQAHSFTHGKLTDLSPCIRHSTIPFQSSDCRLPNNNGPCMDVVGAESYQWFVLLYRPIVLHNYWKSLSN